MSCEIDSDTTLDQTWKVSVFCRNCFDERYVTFINASSQSRRDRFGLNSFPTLGVSLEGRF